MTNQPKYCLERKKYSFCQDGNGHNREVIFDNVQDSPGFRLGIFYNFVQWKGDRVQTIRSYLVPEQGIEKVIRSRILLTRDTQIIINDIPRSDSRYASLSSLIKAQEPQSTERASVTR